MKIVIVYSFGCEEEALSGYVFAYVLYNYCVQYAIMAYSDATYVSVRCVLVVHN